MTVLPTVILQAQSKGAPVSLGLAAARRGHCDNGVVPAVAEDWPTSRSPRFRQEVEEPVGSLRRSCNTQ